MSEPVLFQLIHFTISSHFTSTWPIDRILSGATTPGQSGSGSKDNEGVLRIPQSSTITGTSPWDCLVSYQVHSLVEGVFPLCSRWILPFQPTGNLGRELYPSVEMQSAYCTARPPKQIIEGYCATKVWTLLLWFHDWKRTLKKVTFDKGRQFYLLYLVSSILI